MMNNNNEKTKEVVVIGLGNPLIADEGIGVYLVNVLAERLQRPGVSFHDLGAGGTRILHVIPGKDKVVFIDCCLMGEEPGTMRIFTPEDVRSVKALAGFSLHEGDLLDIINISRMLGECPPELVICGIEPYSLEAEQGITPVLEAKIEEYIKEIIEQI